MDVTEINKAFQQIAGAEDHVILGPLFQNVRAVDAPQGPLLEYQAGGLKPVFRRDHPVAVMYDKSPNPHKVFFLLSALVSVFNRAEATYEDKHEREFHARILDHLLQMP